MPLRPTHLPHSPAVKDSRLSSRAALRIPVTCGVAHTCYVNVHINQARSGYQALSAKVLDFQADQSQLLSLQATYTYAGALWQVRLKCGSILLLAKYWGGCAPTCAAVNKAATLSPASNKPVSSELSGQKSPFTSVISSILEDHNLLRKARRRK